MKNTNNRILVLGVGNILRSDEGVGVRAVEKLAREYVFSENVTLLDGGTQGMLLMGPIMEADVLVVADAVLGGGEPGSIYRLTGADLPLRIDPGKSPHQADLLDTLTYCDVLGALPELVVLGVEPQDMDGVGLELTPVVARRLPDLVRLLLREIERLGGVWSPADRDAEALGAG
ncbi:MAG TPA: HyaD/HybD family hydrogenase maturation endopeptidase [Desulfovibrio sp.]|jgi:hydrogenase maturation protease|uniref:HyaD/HybD family hydrogenase maturation endopeptidase n=1 Tax=Desulfovibrio TaxID=872 RepID=UPI002A3D9090|nr:HyaD/HybD family hydrogenase maturation endopeptidase [Desulfovibrio sp.]MDY0305809.1 HyaD/HybD family hydrogenase maturation endopeptidase [Desulfovibrionaceae bacterium]HMM39347.1 HyaD/HybD family hydrogenase maturation endopeptidase [Desulfovibrio sp.]